VISTRSSSYNNFPYIVTCDTWLAICINITIGTFLCKKESTLKKYVISACIIPGLVMMVLGFVIQNYSAVGFALLGILFSLWQSSRVGILSVLGRK
jgi:Na+/glutamate symporter